MEIVLDGGFRIKKSKKRIQKYSTRRPKKIRKKGARGKNIEGSNIKKGKREL